MQEQLAEKPYQEYLEQVVFTQFRPLIDQELHSMIINRCLEVEIATDYAARAFGFASGKVMHGFSFTEYSNEVFLEKLFKEAYIRYQKDWLAKHLKKIIYLQNLVFEKGMAVKFIDMLPYNGQYVSYMTTYMPITHPNGEVIAIQTSTIETYIIRFQGHIDNPNINTYNQEFYAKFTEREREVLFLICNGASHAHIAELLKIARGTVSAIITNQLCPKFNIPGTNTKMLMLEAIRAGMYRTLPQSLWHPCVINLNKELMDDPNLLDE